MDLFCHEQRRVGSSAFNVDWGLLIAFELFLRSEW